MPREMPTERVSGVKNMTLSVEVFFFCVFGDFSDLVSLSEVTSCCSAARSTSWVEFEKRNAPNSLKLGILGVIQLETLKKKLSWAGGHQQQHPATITGLCLLLIAFCLGNPGLDLDL